jgi:hypothetical protein
MTVWRTANPNARLTDPDNAVPPQETTAAAAQQSVNFVTFEPGWLPTDSSVTEVTRRPEQPPGCPEGTTAEELDQNPHTDGNRCSLRTVVTGDNRRIRLKQFLYDWAPPAGGIAGLWHTSEPMPFDCGNAVGWLGTDYKDNPGAIVQRDRTQIECSVTDGRFSDDELRRLMDGLTPADPDGARVVRGVPFHQLNYWVRYRCRPPGPSHGLWNHSPARPYDECQHLSRAALAKSSPRNLPVPPLVPSGDEFVFDSAVTFPGTGAVECVFRHRANGSDHLWLSAAAEGSSLAPEIPPEPADQSAETRRKVELRGTTVHYAALTEAFGGWEAIWSEDNIRYAAWAGPSQKLDGDEFRNLVAVFMAP